MRRSQERLKDIDNYLKNNYPNGNAKDCAEALSERLEYIRIRVRTLKLLKNRPVDRKRISEAEKNVIILECKLTAKNNELEELWRLVKMQRKEFAALRIENIMLITEKVKARHLYAENNI